MKRAHDYLSHTKKDDGRGMQIAWADFISRPQVIEFWDKSNAIIDPIYR